jgi:beta-mannosidase
LSQDGTSISKRKDRIGFRTIKVVQESLIDAPGSSFLFEVNGRRVFCGGECHGMGSLIWSHINTSPNIHSGSNWIPADNHLTECTEERYRAWLQLMVDGNQNMVRVWGGGVYEFDYFYDICDELGLLVWQDFMFGCGQYPANKQFLESVQVEAEQAVQALRNHASLAIFVSGPAMVSILSIRKYRTKQLWSFQAGNNEDYQLLESIGVVVDYDDKTSDFTKTNFPA